MPRFFIPRKFVCAMVLGWTLLLTIQSFAQDNSAFFFPRADKFFNSVVKNDMVNYAAIKDNPVELNSLVMEIARFDLAAVPDPETRKAFWINAYNILVIHAVVQNLSLIHI